MAYSAFDLSTLKTRLEQAELAGYIYQHQQHILVLQEPFSEDGKPLNIYLQHELTADQIGLQFGLRLKEGHWEFLLGVTYSNQNAAYEIGAGNLKGDQKAFNLLYAFYNYPKAFYLVALPLTSNSQMLEQTLEQQLFSQPDLHFLDTAIKVNPMGEQITWIKNYILQQTLDMKVRIQTALL
ncbi:hypothetical protein HXZ93_00560 [Acinetobacter pseudolwoffii]|uniref:hypothetical protein n=1 Tax=Acinetobacter TaxID=469 RepID=UPI000C24078A|nr:MULTISPECIES: hypothetical protein [Acinetobacter]MDM1334549.1 hypothetical protein [Acinetobacter pseudolwoffii]MDM1340213.1 hypothetical protein [Acinetobacter pseudolwoffii]PJI36446.1 hypothetical protein CU318_02645 [Acinetobacter pseudolwoffii]